MSLRVDGDGGMGYFPMYEGTPLLIDKVKERGIGVLITFNHGHIAAAAIYARLTLKHDLLTFITSGHQLRLHKFRNFNQVGGHSPMCFTAPAGSEDALVLDCGVTNDIGWPDESPEKLMDLAPGLVLRSIGLGTVCQAGEDCSQACHWMGIAWTGNISPSHGAMMIYLKISLFMPPDQFKKEMDAYARAARKLQPPKGNDQTYLPGGIEAQRHGEYLENGIPIGDDHRDWLDTLAAELGIPMPC